MEMQSRTLQQHSPAVKLRYCDTTVVWRWTVIIDMCLMALSAVHADDLAHSTIVIVAFC